MALALYRKYRPATFAEVVGQEHVTEPLRTALATGRINHAYLFSGPRGCGKTSSARILARSLNCAEGPTPDPCGVCSSCVALAPEGPGSLDVVELDAASHGGVDDTRELRDRAFYMPAESRYRVFIIDEAHMVTSQGFNALLKIVEEPPEHLVFIFATTEPEKVLPTIRSRTHHYPFHLLPPATLRALLERLCAEEGVTVEPAVFPLAVKAGAGSARDALSVMDQLLAGAGPEGVTYAQTVALLGVTDAALIDETVDALAAGDGAGVFRAIEKVAAGGHDPRRFGADLLQRLRDLVILKAVPDAAESGILDAPGDELAVMAAQADRLAPATLTRFAEVLHEGLASMRGTTAPRLVLELLAARMLLPAETLSDGGLLQRIERIERRLEISEPGVGGGGGQRGEVGEARYDVSARPEGVAVLPPAAAPQPPPAAGPGPGAAPGHSTASDQAEPPDRAQGSDRAQGPGRSRRPDRDLGEVAAAAAGPGSGGGSTRSPGGGQVRPADGAAGDAAADAPPPRDPVPVGPDLGLPAPPVLSADRAAAGAGVRAPAPTAADGRAPATDADVVGDPGGAADASADGSTAGEEAGAKAPGEAPGPDVPDAADSPDPAGPAGDARAPDAADVRRLWREILAAVQRKRRSTQILLESATVADVSDGILHLVMPTAGLMRQVMETRNVDVLRLALGEVLGVDWRIRCADGESGAAPAGTRAAAPSEARGEGGFGARRDPDPRRDGDRGGAARSGARGGARGGGAQGGGAYGDTARGHPYGGDQYGGDQYGDSYDGAPDGDDRYGDDPYGGVDPDGDVTTAESAGAAVDPAAAAAQLLADRLDARPLDNV